MPWGTNTRIAIGFFVGAVCVVIISSIAPLFLKEGETFTFETTHLPVLSPHVHEISDSPLNNGHHTYLRGEPFTAPHDMWISAMHFQLINASSTTLHHAGISRIDTLNKTCPNHMFDHMAGFASDTMHTPAIEFPEGTGMLLKKGETVQLLVMLHNPLPPAGAGKTYHDVFGLLQLETYPTWKTFFMRPIQFRLLHLDERPCNMLSDKSVDFEFTVPPRTDSYIFRGVESELKPWELVFEHPATIVFLGGHLHGWEGGKELRLLQDDVQFAVFSPSKSIRDSFQYSTPRTYTNMPVPAGTRLRIEAVYENTGDVERNGAMGALDVYYYE